MRQSSELALIGRSWSGREERLLSNWISSNRLHLTRSAVQLNLQAFMQKDMQLCSCNRLQNYLLTKLYLGPNG